MKNKILKNPIRKLIKSIKEKLRDVFVNNNSKKMLKNKSFTIISSNCNGGFLYHDLGIKFNSPTINLFIYPRDFIKFVNNLRYYLSQNLIFVEKINKYPIAKLDDIEIHFVHYKSEDEARKKWYERVKRVNYSNIFILMVERDGCTLEDLHEFDKIKYNNKIVFTYKVYDEIKSSYCISGYEKEKKVGNIFEFFNFFL